MMSIIMFMIYTIQMYFQHSSELQWSLQFSTNKFQWLLLQHTCPFLDIIENARLSIATSSQVIITHMPREMNSLI